MSKAEPISVYGIKEPWTVTTEEVGLDSWHNRTRLTLYRSGEEIYSVEYSRLHEVDAAASALRAAVGVYETARIRALAEAEVARERAD